MEKNPKYHLHLDLRFKRSHLVAQDESNDREADANQPRAAAKPDPARDAEKRREMVE